MNKPKLKLIQGGKKEKSDLRRLSVVILALILVPIVIVLLVTILTLISG